MEDHNEDPEKKAEVQSRVMKVDEYYPVNHQEKSVTDSPLTSRLSQFQYLGAKSCVVKSSDKRATEGTTCSS